MADDWQVGDLALVVIEGRVDCPHTSWASHTGEGAPPKGSVRRVTAVLPSTLNSGRQCGCIDLVFATGERALTQRCKRISSHQPDAEDAETIRLLTGQLLRETTHG